MARRGGNYSTDSKRYYDWLDTAQEDIICARLLLTDEECYNAAAFHCQQNIEKALKAYILLKTDILVDGHNLTWLCKRAMKYDATFSDWLTQSASLNRCYIETRYPADMPLDLSFSQVLDYYNMANEMFAFICAEVEAVLEGNSQHPRQRTEGKA